LRIVLQIFRLHPHRTITRPQSIQLNELQHNIARRRSPAR
jgi:hypothetical protein